MTKESIDLPYRSDFEIRCDEFVAEVETTIVDKYPKLSIYPVNKTRDDLVNIYPEAIELAEASGGGEYLRLKDKMRDEESAYLNEGIVEIYDFEGSSTILQIKEVALKIDKIAARFGGKKEVFGNEEETLNNQELRSLYLIYSFK